MRFIILIFSVSFLFSCTTPSEDQAVTRAELFGHLSYLASDSLKGRFPGTPEDKLAATYIAGEFRKAGLKFLTKDGLQAFDVITDLEIGKNNSFRFENIEGLPDSTFAPFPFTANASLDAEVVFAGYGMDISEQDLIWNDYEGMDVKGRWVMVLRGNVDIDSSSSPFHAYSDERDKAMLAGDKGAAGILFVSGPGFDSEDQLTDLERHEGKVSIPSLHIQRSLADQLLSASGKSIADLEIKISEVRAPISFAMTARVSASAEVLPTTETTYNVIAYLDGNNTQHKENVIVIGAHYDHLGFGGVNSSSRRPDTIAVHNGADDNASGVAALIEIAEKIALTKPGPEHSFLFIAFGAEEMGLLGSKYYVENSLLPIDSTRIMLNLDMVGRMKENHLMIGGVGTALESNYIVETAARKDSLKLELSMEGYGASDHSSFYGKNIPVLFVSTGGHGDYHTPEDDIDNLNIDGIIRVSSFVDHLLAEIDPMDTPLTFSEAGPKSYYSGRIKRRIALGIMPDFTDTDDKDGMRVDLVNPGEAAQLGGMRKGDFIMAIEGKPVNGIYDYMYRLSKLNKGQLIVVTVKRADKELDLLIQL